MMKSFLDARGREWTPIFNTLVLEKWCHILKADLPAVFEIFKWAFELVSGHIKFVAVDGFEQGIPESFPKIQLMIGDMFECVWAISQSEAKERGVTREKFMLEVFTPPKYIEVGAAIWANFYEAWPQPKTGAGGGDDDRPLPPGQ